MAWLPTCVLGPGCRGRVRGRGQRGRDAPAVLLGWRRGLLGMLLLLVREEVQVLLSHHQAVRHTQAGWPHRHGTTQALPLPSRWCHLEQPPASHGRRLWPVRGLTTLPVVAHHLVQQVLLPRLVAAHRP